MEPSEAPSRAYDPARHDSHVVAVFTDRAAADRAAQAVREAGVSDGDVLVLGGAGDPSATAAVDRLFVPDRDFDDYRLALGRGHALVVVRPGSAAGRAAAVAALETCEPLDIDAHAEYWRNPPAERQHPGWNHATVSRADMRGRALPGRDEVVLDMTGQEMTVRTMSQADMAEVPTRPLVPPPGRVEKPAVPSRTVPVANVTYTHGVPPELVARLSPEEQVLAQSPKVEHAPARQFVRIVEDQPVVGWRDQPAEARRVRSYVAERPEGPHRVRLTEEGGNGSSRR